MVSSGNFYSDPNPYCRIELNVLGQYSQHALICMKTTETITLLIMFKNLWQIIGLSLL